MISYVARTLFTTIAYACVICVTCLGLSGKVEAIGCDTLKDEIECNLREQLGTDDTIVTSIHGIKCGIGMLFNLLSVTDNGNGKASVVIKVINELQNANKTASQYIVDVTYDTVVEVTVPSIDIEKDAILSAQEFRIIALPAKKAEKMRAINVLSMIEKNTLVAKHKLKAGDVIKASDVGNPIAVHKGQRITLQFRKHNLSIESSGVCVTSGGIGEVVRVKNIDTNKILSGIVIDSNVVAIGAK